MSTHDPQINFRIPGELKEWFARRAKQTRRTLTAELIIALEEYRAQHEKEEQGEKPTS